MKKQDPPSKNEGGGAAKSKSALFANGAQDAAPAEKEEERPHPLQKPVQPHDILYTAARFGTPEVDGMPWRTMDVHQQRVEFVTAAKRSSQPFRSLCEEFGISRPTG